MGRSGLTLVVMTILAMTGLFGGGFGNAGDGPVLVVRTTRPLEDHTDEASDDRAMALVLASLPPSERAKIREAIDLSASRLEARLSPLLTDFGDDDPVEQLEADLRRYLPLFTAARAFTRDAWRANDLELRVAASCDLTTLRPDDTCIPLWADDDGTGLAGRARFFAWASSNAAVLDFDDAADATACAATLRESALGADSPIALVLGHDALALAELADRAGLEGSAHRFGRALAANERDSPKKDLESLGRNAPSGRVAPWLITRSSTVVVVPRLSAMTRSRELVERIEEAARGRSMTWRHRPRALR